MNLADALAHHARARPDRPALICGPRSIYYRDLDGLVRRWAAHLLALGLAQGQILGIALKDTPEHVLALYAAARLGAVALPMDWRWTDPEKAALALRFRANAILVEADAPAIAGVRCIAVDAAFADAVARSPGDLAFPADGAAPLLLSLSSGTTGRPKGPLVTHGQFLRRFWTHWIDLGLNASDTYVSATPLYFGGGRTFSMSQLFAGGTVVLFAPPYRPEELVAEVERRAATSLFLVPTLLRRLLDLADERLAPVRRLRLLLSSGAPLHPDERRAICRRLCERFHEYYASTEGGGVSLLRPEDIDRHPDSVGRPVFGVEVAIFDAAMRRVAPGEIGRLGYRGPGVAAGFYDDPAAQAEAFRDGWFFPGDLGAVNDAGYVFLRGRAKDMIIRGGVNIYPAEIEAVLQSHPLVRELAVVGWPSHVMGEEVAAFVCLRASPTTTGTTPATTPGAAPTAAEDLRAFCAGRLAPYKVPKGIFAIDDLPRNPSGKVLKAALVARLAACEKSP